VAKKSGKKTHIMKNFRISLTIICLTLSIFLVNCSDSTMPEIESNEQLINENLKKFSIDFLQKSIEIEFEFDKTPKTERNVNFKNELLSVKNDNDFNQIMQKSGFNNSEKLLALFKTRYEIENNFRIKNPEFYRYNLEKRTTMLNSNYEQVYQEYILTQNTMMINTTCAGAYNTQIDRCNRTFGKCAVVAIIAAAGGLWPGVVVGAFCAWDLSDCKSDAWEDYEACI
jgi:hypothetical protein